MIKISAQSLEYVRARVTAEKQGISYNPTGSTVKMAFTDRDSAENATWYNANWETAANDKYYARCLVGPYGTAVLSTGTYKIFVKITDNPEVPVLFVGSLRVY